MVRQGMLSQMVDLHARLCSMPRGSIDHLLFAAQPNAKVVEESQTCGKTHDPTVSPTRSCSQGLQTALKDGPDMTDWNHALGIFQAIGFREFAPFISAVLRMSRSADGQLPETQMQRVLRGEIDDESVSGASQLQQLFDSALRQTKRNTRHYCRKQRTWVRNRLFACKCLQTLT
jgi:hypothetical protein